MKWKKKRIGEDPNYREKRNSRTNRDDNVRVVKRERKRGRDTADKSKDENTKTEEEILKNSNANRERERESKGGSAREEHSAAEVN